MSKKISDLTLTNTLSGGELIELASYGSSLSTALSAVRFYNTPNTYYPDYRQSDQGVTTVNGNRTVADFISLIGSNKATLKFLNIDSNGDGTTTYSFDTSASVPSNIFLDFDNGAEIDRTTGDERLKLNSPGNLVITPSQQITNIDMIDFIRGGTVYSEWWGAVGNGYNDDTNAIQYAINSLPLVSGGGRVQLAPATYKYSTLEITRPMIFEGYGQGESILKTNNQSDNKITVSTASRVKFKDLYLTRSIAQSGGAYIYFNSAVSNFDSEISNCNFAYPYYGIRFETASSFTVKNSYFANYTNAIRIANTVLPDAGDSTIYDCTFDAGGDTGIGIDQYSSGGLKVIHNKFLNGTYHYIGQYNSSPSDTSILIFENNSSEWARTANVAFTATGGTTFKYVNITGNQFSVNNSAKGISVTDPSVDFLDSVEIGSNIFNLGNNTVAINLGRGSRININPNQISGNGTGETGIVIGANVDSVMIHPQDMRNLTTNYSGTFTNVLWVGGINDSGTKTAPTSAAFGSMYITSAQSISFAVDFPIAPIVKANISSTSGGGIACTVGGISTSGFTLYMTGVTDNGSCTCEWFATLV